MSTSLRHNNDIIIKGGFFKSNYQYKEDAFMVRWSIKKQPRFNTNVGIIETLIKLPIQGGCMHGKRDIWVYPSNYF